ncbi:secretion protein HlyD [Telmatospirillum sp.]|uniref:secretion protein HlyD n=1 Tax=Telmatospirillum sp. TaxID=2079197 RepID=UPI00283F091B|nr:secretion protein HlyD [Telmatospirillum sp.]MDR3435368.1 secretion protein HlyD [Telmatospirillum sp.]
MKKKLALAGVLLLVAVALAATGFDIPARMGWSGKRDAPLTLYGNVDIRQVQLGFRVGGRIAEALVDEGDTIEAGMVLARLDPQPYQDTLHSAEAQLRERKATRDKLVAGPRVAEIAQARAVYAEQQANLVNARKDFEKARNLLPSGAVSQSIFDQATAAKDMAVARESAAREALRLLEEGNRAEDIEAARASLSAAEASLSAARTSLQDTEIRAPADGTILSRVREPGAIVSTSDIVYVLSLDQPVWVRSYVPETDLGRIHPGMTVTLTSDGTPAHPYQGTIGFVSPVSEFTPKSVETPELRTDLVYRLRIVVDHADPGLRQGMPVTVHVPRTTTSAGDAK